MNTIILTIISTLVIYSAIGCIAYWMTKEDDTLTLFGFGIVGWIFYGIISVVLVIKKAYRHNTQYAIFEDGYCKLKYKDDAMGHEKWFKRITSNKGDLVELTPYTKEQIAEFKRNCNHCIHDKKGGKCYHKSTDECLCALPKDPNKPYYDADMDLTFPHFEKK